MGTRIPLTAAFCIASAACNGTIREPSFSGTGSVQQDETDRPRPVDPDQTVDPDQPTDPGPGGELPAFRALEPLVRRLTVGEYAKTVEDVIGLSLTEAQVALLPVDRPLEGFVNIASGQTVLPEHALAYAELAEAISSTDEAGVFLASHTDCPDDTDACAAALVESSGLRLFRRPLTADDSRPYVLLYRAVRAEAADHEEAARATLEAMLQAPEFLYLLEGEDAVQVGSYELASRLAYGLWGTAPEPWLLDAAARGDLETPAGLRAAVDRLLDDDARVGRVLNRFIVDWGRMASIPNEDGLKDDLIAGAERFYRGELLAGAELFGLFTRRKAALTEDLARAYGVADPGAEFQTYDVQDLPGRGGLLAQPGVVAGMTNADGGAIVARGLFMQKQLFCSETPDPPASLQEQIDEFVEEQPENASDRQIAEVRLTRNQCAACHKQFDPLAYGFEHLDYRGAYREQDVHGNAVRIDGWIPAALTADRKDYAYQTYEAYMQALAVNDRVRSCFVQRQLEYFLGHRLESEHARAVADVRDAVETGPGRYEDLVRAIVAHDVFRTRKIP